jgi:hypothetical protein
MSLLGFDKKKEQSAQLMSAHWEEGKTVAPPEFALESGTPQSKSAGATADTSYSGSASHLNAGMQQTPAQLKAAVDGLPSQKLTTMGEAPVQAKMASSSPIQMMGRANKEKELPTPDQLPGNEEMVREIFNFFYPGMDPGPITESAEQLAAEMMAEAIRGSEAMDFVPRPPAVPSPTWLFTEAVKMAWRRGQSQGIYTAVRNQVARGFRSRFEMVRNGI